MCDRWNAAKERRGGNDQYAPGLLFGELRQDGHALHLGASVRHDVEECARIRRGEQQDVGVFGLKEETEIRLVAIGFFEVGRDDHETSIGVSRGRLRDCPVEGAPRDGRNVDPVIGPECHHQITNRCVRVL